MEGRGRHPSSQPDSPPMTSYVYPIRLPLGDIQPAHRTGISTNDDETNRAQPASKSARLVGCGTGCEVFHEALCSPETDSEAERPRSSQSTFTSDDPLEKNPFSLRNFSPRRPPISIAPHAAGGPVLYTASLAGEPVMYVPTNGPPCQLPKATVDLRAPLVSSPDSAVATPENPPSGVSNATIDAASNHFSQSDIVHLPSRDSPSLNRAPASILNNPDRLEMREIPLRSHTGQLWPADDGSDKALGQLKRMPTDLKHVQDSDGYQVLIGIEGTLASCEDEPTLTHGAVQGFGVFVALEIDETSGNLVVRQVSENSTKLLGLSPRYLFSLECFSQTLPGSQADVLFANIDCVYDVSLTDEQVEDVPIFLLNGFGELGSALDGEGADDHGRRTWTCWCAVHRPRVSTSDGLFSWDRADKLGPNLIVLELELEHDIFNALNPLYPPPVEAPSSPSSNSSRDAASLGGGSDSTLASASPYTSETSETLSGSPPGVCAASQIHDLLGDEDWAPSPEDIVASTLSRSKPLPALERLLACQPPEVETQLPAFLSSESPSPRRRRRRRNGHGRSPRLHGIDSAGVMDCLAVMAQINTQLEATQDLQTLMEVTVGVLKDLARFHRVFAIQFDEAGNGQVMAELVDWGETHDLFLGLHFPATDIPTQAPELYPLNNVRILYDREEPTARIIVRSEEDLVTPLDMSRSCLRAMNPAGLEYLESMGVRASMSISLMAFGTMWGMVSFHSYGPRGMRMSLPVRQMLGLLGQTISHHIERLIYAQRMRRDKLINPAPTDQYPTGYIVSNAEDLLNMLEADFAILAIGEGAKFFGPNEHGQEILVIAEYLRLQRFDRIQVSQELAVSFPDLPPTSPRGVIAGLLYVPLSVSGRDYMAFMRKEQLRTVRWAGRPQKSSGGASPGPFKVWSEAVAGRCRAWAEEHLEAAATLGVLYGKFIEVRRCREVSIQHTRIARLLLTSASHEVRTPLDQIINYLEMAMNGPLSPETRENLNRSHVAAKSLIFAINELLDLARLETRREMSPNAPFDLPQTIDDAAVFGDPQGIRAIVTNLTANALRNTSEGSVSVVCQPLEESAAWRECGFVTVEIVVEDTGCGIPDEELQSILRELEGVVTTASEEQCSASSLGPGLLMVWRIARRLGGQLRVESTPGKGSRFSLSLRFLTMPSVSSGITSCDSSLQENGPVGGHPENGLSPSMSTSSSVEVPDVASSLLSTAVEESASERPLRAPFKEAISTRVSTDKRAAHGHHPDPLALRILIVDDNHINLSILTEHLSSAGHAVVEATDGQECIDLVGSDRGFDCILMDIQMPLVNGYEATRRIRELELAAGPSGMASHALNNGRIPILATSTSLSEKEREAMHELGLDGWVTKPVDFERLCVILHSIMDPAQRELDVYRPGCDWELGGWFSPATGTASPEQAG